MKLATASSQRSILGLWVLALFLTFPLSGQDVGRTAFTSEDALNVASIQVYDVTDDGRYLVASRYTQRDRKNVDHMRFGDPTYVSPSFSELLVIDTESGSETLVFEERVQVRSAVFSPDGSTVAFFLRRGEEYSLQTYEVGRDRVRELRLQSEKAIASNSPLMWRPDGTGILLGLRADDWAEISQRMYLDLSEGPVIVQDSRNSFLAWDSVRSRSALLIPAMVNVESRQVRELLPEGRYTEFNQAEDGSFITYSYVTPVKTSYERNKGTEYEVFMLAMEDLTVTSLTEKSEDRVRPNWNDAGNAFAYSEEGNVFVRTISDEAVANLTEEHRDLVSEDDTTKLRFSVERWSPDDAALLVGSQRGYHLLDVETGEIEMIFEKPEDDDNAPELGDVSWSPDGQFIYMTYSAQDKWERGLVRLNVRSHQIEDLVKDENLYSRWMFSKDGEKIFYQFSDGDLPNELYMSDARMAQSVQLTNMNPWLAQRKLTRSELIEYLDVDGNTLYGILYYPVDYEPGTSYPLVAEIYEEFFNNGFNHRMNLLANAGFFGFRPSVKLEIGYPGEAWLKAVTTGINVLIDRGLVDGDKLGVHGTSYGGYATNLLIAQTDRFAAAINISGKVNIVSFLGDSPKITTRNYRAAEDGQDRIGATLWEQPLKYVAHSAVMYADRIETPLLLLSGEGDWNVPATNQREMYYALRRLGKEVVWVHYMNAGHGAGRSSTVDDFHDHWQRIVEWYTSHFEKEK